MNKNLQIKIIISKRKINNEYAKQKQRKITAGKKIHKKKQERTNMYSQQHIVRFFFVFTKQ